MKKFLIVLLFAIAIGTTCYNLRAFLPLVGDYPTSLTELNGWSSLGYYGLNCTAFVALAHGEHFVNIDKLYAVPNNTLLIYELPNRYSINESRLQPGDLAVFRGPYSDRVGLHVTAYLGNGNWIDSDTRRGQVAKYRLVDKPANDDWFQGEVRILRWKSAPKKGFRFHFFSEEQREIGQ